MQKSCSTINLLAWNEFGNRLFVSRCPQCLTHRNQLPWTKVASDLFTLYGHDYVIIADYTSKYTEIERLIDKSSQR